MSSVKWARCGAAVDDGVESRLAFKLAGSRRSFGSKGEKESVSQLAGKTNTVSSSSRHDNRAVHAAIGGRSVGEGAEQGERRSPTRNSSTVPRSADQKWGVKVPRDVGLSQGKGGPGQQGAVLVTDHDVMPCSMNGMRE